MADYYSLKSYEDGPHMVADPKGKWAWGADLAAARTEIERLTARAEKAEAERDQARAWVAKAFKMAMNETAKGPGFIDRIRELTPADAKAALEAYGREKVREGVRRAVDKIMDRINNTDFAMNYHAPLTSFCKSILAEMEKEGGE